MRTAPPRPPVGLPPELGGFIAQLGLHALNVVGAAAGLVTATWLALAGLHAVSLAQAPDERLAAGLTLLAAGGLGGATAAGFAAGLLRARRLGR